MQKLFENWRRYLNEQDHVRFDAETDEEGVMNFRPYIKRKKSDIPSLTPAQRKAWLASQQPPPEDSEDYVDTSHIEVETGEDWEGDPAGRAVHLAAKDVCGDDQQCYIEYVMTHDPELQDVPQDG